MGKFEPQRTGKFTVRHRLIKVGNGITNAAGRTAEHGGWETLGVTLPGTCPQLRHAAMLPPSPFRNTNGSMIAKSSCTQTAFECIRDRKKNRNW